MTGIADLGHCLGCAAALAAGDEVCRACGLPVATSDRLDLAFLGERLGRAPAANGRLGRRLGLVVGDDGIALRGIRRARFYAWGEIRRFDIGLTHLWAANPTSCLVIVLRAGGHVKVNGVTSEGFVWNRPKMNARMALHAAALNLRLLAGRAGEATSPPAVV